MNAPLLLAIVALPQSSWPAPVEAALAFAGENRPQIERFLERYRQGGDAQQLDAALFLVEHMRGHGFVEYALVDEAGGEVAFDALAHERHAAAQAAMDALEAAHGPLRFEPRALVEDLHVLTAEQLIQNHELAFETWRTAPWTRGLSYETFREHVLPHRGSNEPLEDWRGPWRERLRALFADLPPDASAAEIARRASAEAARLVQFRELYYLHPTDQGYAEMLASGAGRCEDITNMQSYALRAAGVASAADYTPWWGHRDNNHAWSVVLDAEGRGRAPDGKGAAKVYRKTYSRQAGSLAAQLAEGETAPRWLDRPGYVDVTDQYGPVFDVTVELAGEPRGRFAYLCVFNGGEWRAIHWGRVQERRVTFDRMGPGLLYLPAWYVEGELRPAAPPRFLTREGAARELVASEREDRDAWLWTTGPAKPELDERGAPRSRLEPGADYELFVWRDGWTSLGRHVAGQTPLAVELPAGGLYWLVRDGSRRLERPFELQDGALLFH